MARCKICFKLLYAEFNWKIKQFLYTVSFTLQIQRNEASAGRKTRTIKFNKSDLQPSQSSNSNHKPFDTNMNITLLGTAALSPPRGIYVLTVLLSLMLQKHVHFTATVFFPNCHL